MKELKGIRRATKYCYGFECGAREPVANSKPKSGRRAKPFLNDEDIRLLAETTGKLDAVYEWRANLQEQVKKAGANRIPDETYRRWDSLRCSLRKQFETCHGNIFRAKEGRLLAIRHQLNPIAHQAKEDFDSGIAFNSSLLSEAVGSFGEADSAIISSNEANVLNADTFRERNTAIWELETYLSQKRKRFMREDGDDRNTIRWKNGQNCESKESSRRIWIREKAKIKEIPSFGDSEEKSKQHYSHVGFETSDIVTADPKGPNAGKRNTLLAEQILSHGTFSVRIQVFEETGTKREVPKSLAINDPRLYNEECVNPVIRAIFKASVTFATNMAGVIQCAESNK